MQFIEDVWVDSFFWKGFDFKDVLR